jgi:hypothetical protein
LNSTTGPPGSFQQEAERIRSSGVLGEARVRRLFDYLVAHSADERPPKEATLAVEVFGKDSTFDVSQDALVRVYVHKLRRLLEEFYTGQSGSPALQLPRGEYRLVLRANEPTVPSDQKQPATSSPVSRAIGAPRYTRRQMVTATVVASAASVLLTVGVLRRDRRPSDLELVRANPIWAPILDDDRPILIVVGDYYLIGETDDSMEVKRLIREYSVNSKDDLANYVNQHPEAADRYMDVGLSYLPTSVAFALRNIMPVLDSARRRVTLSTMSHVTPAILKSANIIYIGYLSGLGILQQMVFSGSRFSIGDSYDELRDTKTGRLYISQTASQNIGVPQSSGKQSAYRDYGLFSSFRGPSGNAILVVSGTRDEGVRQTAEAFTNAAKLGDLRRLIDPSQSFESLLEVSALDGVNLTGKFLVTSER